MVAADQKQTRRVSQIKLRHHRNKSRYSLKQGPQGGGGGGGAGRAQALPRLLLGLIYFLGLQMARKCKVNGETLTLKFVCIDQNFKPYHFKMVSMVPVESIILIT